MLDMWAQSSTMEYPGEPSQDLLGLGAYDFGAARMFYGDAATVYSDKRFKSTDAAGAIAEDHQNEFGGLLGYRYGDFSSPIHYSQLDGAVNLIEKCAPVQIRKPSSPPTGTRRRTANGAPIVDGHIVTDEDGKPTRCTQPKVDFVQWDALKDTDEKTHASRRSRSRPRSLTASRATTGPTSATSRSTATTTARTSTRRCTSGWRSRR